MDWIVFLRTCTGRWFDAAVDRVDRLLFEKMNADVYFDKIRKSLKEN